MADLQSPKDRITLRNGYGIPCLGFGTWKMPDGEVGIDAVHQLFMTGIAISTRRHLRQRGHGRQGARLGRHIARGPVHHHEGVEHRSRLRCDAQGVRGIACQAAPHYVDLYLTPLARCAGRRGRMAAHEPGDVAGARDALPGRPSARYRHEPTSSPTIWSRS